MKYKLPELFSIICFLFFSQNTFSQISQVTSYADAPSMQSPNANTLGRFGDIPVSLFNGTTNINIPLTEIKNGSISVPISLVYNSEGCRPDQHPTWVGLNWSLQAGGVITRTANGNFDECVDIDNGTQYSYYDIFTSLSTPNWSNLVQMGMGDLSPDEFSFSVGNISGKFMLNHEGKWIVQSKNNLNLKVVHEIQTNYSVYLGSESVIVPRSYTKFILITGDGTKYIFGDKPDAIEFSLPHFPREIGIDNLGDPVSSDTRGWKNSLQASTWHLSEIISPSGNHVTFSYTTDFSFQQVTYSQISNGLLCGTANFLYVEAINDTRKYLIKSAYLDKIETDNGLICKFSKSISNELKWIPQASSIPHVFIRQPSYLFRYYKLDALELKVNSKTTKKIALGYIEKSTERLKLNKVEFLSLSGDQKESIYRMEYNNKPLPVYNSGHEDHWGFYNGKNYWETRSATSYTMPNIAEYYESREADPNFMDAEIIKRIIYPTGGYSEFSFEPHTYSKIIKQSPTIILNTLTTNKIAGGLRIKKIETYDSFSNVPQVKEYFYNTDYINGGMLSSGVLSGEPIYQETLVNNLIYKFSSSPLLYLNSTNGNHITSSKVTIYINQYFTNIWYK
ncbi:hypothetical protein [Flavobacterium salmonis]|uniref:YD repeat-containing protein n=1 Tax=Flavobacterium salmonis TaxID=2654844 RepID=A0A6V6YS24_9FLAO|nr:hypothetical protein [Flavobacterium salmonis]CAD0002216.1 hypothetical protein FLAT13_00977 [Flavobacterium salmonis]